jgi:hypothetical protein
MFPVIAKYKDIKAESEYDTSTTMLWNYVQSLLTGIKLYWTSYKFGAFYASLNHTKIHILQLNLTYGHFCTHPDLVWLEKQVQGPRTIKVEEFFFIPESAQLHLWMIFYIIHPHVQQEQPSIEGQQKYLTLPPVYQAIPTVSRHRVYTQLSVQEILD